MKPGEVYRFSYLRRQEDEKGEESGRKIRRVALLIRQGEWLYLFPTSGQEPQPDEEREERVFLVVPDTERRRIGLGNDTEKVTHLILDEYNRVRVDQLYDFESARPIGTFSAAFQARIGKTLQEAVKNGYRPIGLTRS